MGGHGAIVIGTVYVLGDGGGVWKKVVENFTLGFVVTGGCKL